jgi:hypothetical protein
MTKRKLGTKAWIAIVGVGGLVSVAALALPTGITSAILASVVVAGGEYTAVWPGTSTGDGEDFEATITTSGPMRVITQHAIVQPGGQFDWHYHSGIVIGEVVSGTLTFYEASDPTCTGTPYSAGQGFAENGSSVHIHNSRNEGTVPVEVYFTFVQPPGATRTFWVPNPGVCASRGF